MKKIYFLYLVSFSLITFAACKKDSDSSNSNYYIKANVGGTEKTYSANPAVSISSQTGMYTLLMSAGAGGSSLEGMQLQIIRNDTMVTAGIYIESSAITNYIVGASYNPGSTELSAVFGAGFQFFTSKPLQIIISDISDTQVSGTFSGGFYDNNGLGTDSLFVTNGSFHLPVQ